MAGTRNFAGIAAVFAVVLAFLTAWPACAGPAAHSEAVRNEVGALAAIDAAVAAGEISAAEGLLNKVRLVRGSADLPKRFAPAGDEPIKCGTAILLEAKERLADLPEDVRSQVILLSGRPESPEFIDSDHFRVHYETSGPNVIMGWPNTAYRDSVVAACERSWRFYHLENGWQIPPSDGTKGGNQLIDCYVTDAGGAYGWTQAESPSLRWSQDHTAFFVIDHAYDPPFPYANRILPMQITVAHEYHHVVQMGYSVDNKWWMENVAVFMEDEVYDQVDDNQQYLYYYMNFPYQALSTFNGSHEYAGFIWPTLLKEKWSHDVVRQVYQCTASGTEIGACFDAALAAYGTGFDAAVAEWGVWNFYTGSRDDGRHYIEGGRYASQMAFDQQFSTYPQIDRHPTPARRPEPTGQSVMHLARNTASPDKRLTVDFHGPACTQQVVVVVKEAGRPVFTEWYMNLDGEGDGRVDISGWNNAEYAHLIVQMPSQCATAQDYSFDATTTGATAVESPALYTRMIELDQNEPNPFGPQTRIGYRLGADLPVALAVFDAAGRQVRGLIQARQAAGAHEVGWDGRDDRGERVGPGVYFYRLQVAGDSEVRKMVIAE